MKFTLEIGEQEKHRIEYYRNWFFGTERLLVNGKMIARSSGFTPSTHFGFHLSRHFDFTVGEAETHAVVLEKKRPILIAGFRPHTYRVYVDDRLVHEQTGF
ncbi:MAG: hypothetical protein WCD79_07385 [Chthoniobacteraceae bacterium]